MAQDYSRGVQTNESGTISVAIFNKDLSYLTKYLDSHQARHTVAKTATGTPVLEFGSDVTVDNLRKLLKQYTELF